MYPRSLAPRQLAASTALAILATGCDRAPMPTASSSAAPQASSASAPAEAAGLAALPPAPVLPAARCTLRTSSWTAPRVRLLISDAGSPFAEAGMSGVMASVFAAKEEAEALLPEGPARRFGLRVTTTALSLEGLVDAAAFPIHAAKPLVLGGFVILKQWTDLKVLDVSTAGIEIEPDLGATIAPATPLRARQACGDLAVEAQFDAETALPAAKTKRRATLKAGNTIPLSVEPSGTAVARLTPKNDAEVDVLEASGTAARIAYRGGEALVFGWVAASDLGPPPPASGGRRKGEEGSMGAAPEKAAPLATVTCDKDVPLVAQAGEDRATVGRVRAQARIDVLEKAGGWARVRVANSVVHAAPKALWKVREADLASCPPAKEEESPWGQGLDPSNLGGIGTVKKK